MALLDFPTGPQLNDTTTQNGNTWKWNGTSWVAFNNLSLSSQVTGILAVQYGGTGFGGTYAKGDILYALSSNTFGKLSAGAGGSILAINSSGDLYWKLDDAGSGSVGSGSVGGLAYYTSTTNITSGTAFSYINGTSNIVLTNGLLSLPGSTVNSGTWAGNAVTLPYGGTNNTISGIGHSYRVAMYDSAGTAITNISSVGTASSVLFQSSQSVSPTWVGQNTLVVGGATTAANVQGGGAGSIVYNTSASTTTFLNNSGTAGSVLVTVSGSGIAWTNAGSLSVGSATNSTNSTNTTNVNVTSATGAGTSFLAFVSSNSGNLPILMNSNITVDAASKTITADNFTGIASSTTRVGITTQSGAGTSFLYFGNVASGYAALGSTTDITVIAQTGQINAKIFSGTATSAQKANNIIGGSAGAGQSLHIQTGVDTTSFLNTTATAGYALTTTGSGNLAFGALTSLAVTALSAGPNISVSGSTGSVSISNIGATSVTAGSNSITISSSGSGGTGRVTVDTAQNITTTGTPTFDTISVRAGTLTTTSFSAATDIVNKQYVDNLASGLDIHGSVRVIIASAIGGSYYQPGYGIGGTAIGAYITSIGNSDLTARTFDGKTLAANQRVLVNAGLTATGKTSINGSALVTPSNSNVVNGIYYVGNVGSGSSQWYLYRALDTDENTELTGGTFVFVEEGDSYADTGFVCSNDTTNLGPIQFGSTAVTFTQFTGAAAFNVGQGLTKVGNTVAVNVNLSSTGVPSGTGYTQFNIGGPSVGGVADTGYYPTFSVRTSGNTVAGSSILTLNSDGFSLIGATGTQRTVTVTGSDITLTGGGNTLTLTGSISLPAPTQYAVAYGTGSALAFLAAAGSGASVLTQTSGSNPVYLGQSQLVVGGATTAANIQGGALGNIHYQTGTNATGFVSNAAGSGSSVLTQNGNTAPVFLGQSQLVVGGASTAANIQGGGAGQLVYNTAASTTAFLSNSGTAGSVLVTVGTSGVAWTNAGSLSVGSAANITSGSANQIPYQTGANATSFISTAGGSGASVLTQTAGSAPTYLGQSQLVVGGASTSANIQGGSAHQIPYQTGANTTSFISTAGGSGASVLTQTAGSAPVYIAQSQMSVGSATNATNATNVNTTSVSGAGSSFLVFAPNNSTGNQALYVTSSISVDANTKTIYATSFSGLATSATKVGITTTVTNGDLPIVFSDVHQPYAALGSSTLLTYNPSNGKITNGIWAGTAITTRGGGTGFNTVSANQVLMGAATGNTWAGVASTNVPVVAISDAAPTQPGGAIGATQAGQLWWDSQYGVLKVYYNDGNTSQWVDATPVLGSSGGGSSVKRSYVMTFGAGFTPSTGADTVQIQIPYAPDNTSKYYYIKRLDYRNETTSSGAGVSFYIERFTGGAGAFNIATSGNRIHSGSGLSFVASAGIYITSYTLSSTGASFVSSAGVAGSVISGDYLRLNFAAINSAATMSVSMVIEEQ